MTQCITIDWPIILADLAWMLGEVDPANGLQISIGQQALADSLGYPRGTVRRWFDGAMPRWDDGERLLERWCSLSGKRREFAPLTTAVLSATDLRDHPPTRRRSDRTPA